MALPPGCAFNIGESAPISPGCTVRNVPLGYRFKLYNYDPYDSTVLGDLSQATTLKAIKSQTVYFLTGYDYEYSPSDRLESLCNKITVDLAKYENDLNGVLEKYGKESASSLELISTIVFAEREMRRKRQTPEGNVLRDRVKKIKSHFTDEAIADEIKRLSGDKLISVTVE